MEFNGVPMVDIASYVLLGAVLAVALCRASGFLSLPSERPRPQRSSSRSVTSTSAQGLVEDKRAIELAALNQKERLEAELLRLVGVMPAAKS